MDPRDGLEGWLERWFGGMDQRDGLEGWIGGIDWRDGLEVWIGEMVWSDDQRVDQRDEQICKGMDGWIRVGVEGRSGIRIGG
jgi:hypothetical protein